MQYSEYQEHKHHINKREKMLHNLKEADNDRMEQQVVLGVVHGFGTLGLIGFLVYMAIDMGLLHF